VAEQSETTTSAISSAFHGVVCGMSYYNNGHPIVSGSCDNNPTLVWQPPYAWPWDRQNDGDRGADNNAGFYHQSWHANNITDMSMLPLPNGTACGFKETCNNSGETCFGHDAKNECPLEKGWIRRTANDMGAPNGCYFVWCEYTDPNNLCLNGNCTIPTGLTCGITDPDYNASGTCLAKNTQTQGCPTNLGFLPRGNYDAGRPAGHGLRWCEKQ
jgi:hypothetical protein